MTLSLKIFLIGTVGVFLTVGLAHDAVSAKQKKLFGESEYEACLLKSDATYTSLSNGDTYCCSKSQGQCIRCPRDGNIPCSIITYSKHPRFPQMSKPVQNQTTPPKVAPADPKPKRPNLKAAQAPKLSQ